MECHLYVTDRCNLDCHYCTEYDNSVPHPQLEDLKRWIKKIADLEVSVLNLQGGEPLLHPDIVEIVRYSKSLGLGVTMSSNGFLLTKDLVAELDRAGLDILQLSVDRMTPTDSTRKSLKTVIPKMALLENSSIKYHISGVLFNDSVAEAGEVLEYGLGRNIPTQARLVHADPEGEFRVGADERDDLMSMVDLQLAKKRNGEPVHTNSAILSYQRDMLGGTAPDWTCMAGYKFFFVSATGEFWLCSMRHDPGISIMDVTPEILRGFYTKKDCQSGCGVYCVISASLFAKNPVRFIAKEVRDRAQALFGRLISGGTVKPLPLPPIAAGTALPMAPGA
jgi:MoaA/NifB/PqqE/SkfB family radical SAM enzyme